MACILQHDGVPALRPQAFVLVHMRCTTLAISMLGSSSPHHTLSMLKVGPNACTPSPSPAAKIVPCYSFGLANTASPSMGRGAEEHWTVPS